MNKRDLGHHRGDCILVAEEEILLKIENQRSLKKHISFPNRRIDPLSNFVASSVGQI
jgi:hypothetical protein